MISQRKLLGKQKSVRDEDKVKDKKGYESPAEFRKNSSVFSKYKKAFESYSDDWSNAEKKVRADQKDRKNRIMIRKNKPTTDPKDRPYLGKDRTSTKGFEEEVFHVVEGEAWTKSEGQNKEGGLNEKGRKSYERANPGSDLKAPSKEKGNPRRKSFCARMKGMRKRQKKSNNTGEDRLSKSLRAWDC